MKHLSVKSLVVIVLMAVAKPLVAQNDSTVTFEQLHYKLLEDYLLFVDTMEKKPITESWFGVQSRRHISTIEFYDGKHHYTLHKRIKIYKSGMRFEKIKWFRVKGSYHQKLYVIKTLGIDYRYIKQYSYNENNRLTKKIICLDDNYMKVHVFRPKNKRSEKNYLKHESSLPASHQN